MAGSFDVGVSLDYTSRLKVGSERVQPVIADRVFLGSGATYGVKNESSSSSASDLKTVPWWSKFRAVRIALYIAGAWMLYKVLK